MWIVKLALRRPYTFIVLAVMLFILGPLAIMRTPTDIFPNINIPVVSIVWTYNGFSAQDMAYRITSNYERALTSDVDDIEHIESQSVNGVSVVKVFFHPGADINRAVAQAAANSASILRILPPGTLPPSIITYNASTVPVLQLGLSSNSLPEQSLYDLGNSFIRTQLTTVEGAAVPSSRRGSPPRACSGRWGRSLRRRSPMAGAARRPYSNVSGALPIGMTHIPIGLLPGQATLADDGRCSRS
jgi:multidrug efflux pump subunit AcrB